MKNVQIRNISIFRGIMLCYIIMGHIGFTGIFDYYIHAFHVPVFFIISGYCFKPCESLKAYLGKKVQSMLIPYVVFALVHFFLAFWLVEEFHWKNALGHIFWMNNSGMPISGSLWFVTSIFFASIVYQILDLKVKEVVRNIIIVVAMIIGFVCPIRLPFSTDTALVGLGFMHLGRYLRLYEPRKQMLKNCFNVGWIGSLLLLLVQVIATFCNTYVNMRKTNYGFIPLFIINVILAFVVYHNLSKKIENISWLSVKQIVSVLERIGNYSIYFLAFNELGIKLWNLVMPELTSENFIIKLVYKFSELGCVILFIFVVCCLFECLKKCQMRRKERFAK